MNTFEARALAVIKVTPNQGKLKNLMVHHKTCHTSVTNCNDPNLLAKYTTEGIII